MSARLTNVRRMSGASLFHGVCAIVLLGATPAFAQDKPIQRTITVSATGKVAAIPDIAHVTFGVSSEAKTAREAMSANTETMAKIVAKLKERGIDPKDIQTSGLNLQLRQASNAQEQDTYSVSNQVQLVVRDLNRLGDLLDALVSLGVNQVQGLSFEASNAETLRDEARKKAMTNAKRRAMLLAAAAEVELGDVLAISDETVGFRYGNGVVAYGNAVPIERGAFNMEARITVVWALK